MNTYNPKQYLGNALIVAPDQLPQIGQRFGVGILDKQLHSSYCVSVDLTNETDTYYIFTAKYADVNEYFDSIVNISSYSYAVNIDAFTHWLLNK